MAGYAWSWILLLCCLVFKRGFHNGKPVFFSLFYSDQKMSKRKKADARKYAQAEGVTLPPSEEICPSGGSNSPAVGA